MSIKAIEATDEQLATALAKSMKRNPAAMLRAYEENPRIFKDGVISKKAIGKELSDRFSKSTETGPISIELLDSLDLRSNISLKELADNAIYDYMETVPDKKLRFNTAYKYSSKDEYIKWLEDFSKKAENFKKQATNDIKQACKDVIKSCGKRVKKLKGRGYL